MRERTECVSRHLRRGLIEEGALSPRKKKLGSIHANLVFVCAVGYADICRLDWKPACLDDIGNSRDFSE